MRIVFMGTPDFAVPSLAAMLRHGENVVAVVSQPDRPKGRGRKLAVTPVKELALAHGIPVLQPTAIRTEAFREELAAFWPDLIVVTAYGRILPGELLRLPRFGTINVHASLLPKYRGAAPIQWAVINDETVTGVTIMQMDEGLDTGDILLPVAINIAPDDTSATLALKLSDLGGKALVQALDLLRQEKLVPQKQENEKASFAPLLKKDDGIVDWRKGAQQVSALIRGMDPWPCASSNLNEQRLRLFAAQAVACEGCQSALEPGVVCRADGDGVLVAASDGLVNIRELQREGGRRLPAAAFLQGFAIAEGAQFG